MRTPKKPQITIFDCFRFATETKLGLIAALAAVSLQKTGHIILVSLKSIEIIPNYLKQAYSPRFFSERLIIFYSIPLLGVQLKMIKTVIISSRARRQLRKVPLYIVHKLAGWVISVEGKGIVAVRKIPGYHDEPLTGARKGQRSIRLSISYRAVYQIRKDETTQRKAIEFVSVEEVTKHKY